MTESEHMSDLHLIQPSQPSLDQQAVAFYNLLRSANPHMPDPTKVLADSELALSWSGYGLATLTLTISIDLPEEAKAALRGQS